jgi:hypothetical protein
VLFGYIDAYRFLFYICTLASGVKGQYNKAQTSEREGKSKKKPKQKTKSALQRLATNKLRYLHYIKLLLNVLPTWKFLNWLGMENQ